MKPTERDRISAIIVAIVVAIIGTISMKFLYPITPFYVIPTFFIGFFGFTYTIITNTRVLEAIEPWLKKTVEIRWLLIISFFLLFIILMNYPHFSNTEGNLKCVLENGKIINIPYSKNGELEHVFPQVSKIPFISTETYEANGLAKSQIHNDTLDGRKYFFEIKLQNYKNSLDSNSGWMIFPLWGYDASKYDYLSFWVKGANGNEKFGVKLKDTSGREVKVEAMEYIEGKKVDPRWKQVIIPLERFLDVDKSSLNVISLYSDGELSYNYQETIYVTDFEFYK